MFNGNSAYASPGPNSRSMQALSARMERLEHIVRAENSIEAMAQVRLQAQRVCCRQTQRTTPCPSDAGSA